MPNENQTSVNEKNSSPNGVDTGKRGFLKKAGVALGGLTFGSAALSSPAGAIEYAGSRGTVRLGQNTSILEMNRGNSGLNSPGILVEGASSDARIMGNKSEAAVMLAPPPAGGLGAASSFAWTGYEFVARGNSPTLAHVISRGNVGGYLEAGGFVESSVNVRHVIKDITRKRTLENDHIWEERRGVLTVGWTELQQDNYIADEVSTGFRKKNTVKLHPGRTYRIQVPLRATVTSNGGTAASNFHPDAAGLTGPFRGSGVGAGLGGQGGRGLKLKEILIRFP